MGNDFSRFEEIKLSRDIHTMHVSDDQRINQKKLFEHLNMVSDARQPDKPAVCCQHSSMSNISDAQMNGSKNKVPCASTW